MLHKLSDFKSKLENYQFQQPYNIALSDKYQTINYADLLSEVNKRQEILKQLDVKVVALYLENSVDLMLWDLTLLFSEIPTIILPPFFSSSQLNYCLEISQADLVISNDNLNLDHLDLYFKDACFWRLKSAKAVEFPQSTQKLTFTSGTTGHPKAVCLGSEQILTVAKSLSEAIDETKPQKHLALMPLAVLLENIGCYAMLYRGAQIELVSASDLGLRGASGVDVHQFSHYLNQSKPHSLILVPQFLSVLVEAVSSKLLRAEDYRFIAVGGGHVNPDLLKRAQTLNLPVYEGYGLSECASVVALNTPAQQRAGSVGKPLAHVEVSIANDGEILVANNQCLGYLGSNHAPVKYWPTGDLGMLDEDGYLYIHGRKKHQFITSFGRNVNPEWVEALLSQTGVVGQAFVYGEALPENYALLWPVHSAISNDQIEQVVEQANIKLPDYARVKHWVRLTEPFSTTNQLATANGRLRRDEIVSRYHNVFSA